MTMGHFALAGLKASITGPQKLYDAVLYNRCDELSNIINQGKIYYHINYYSIHTCSKKAYIHI